MGLRKRPFYVGTVAAAGLATVALTGAFAGTAAVAVPSSAPQFVPLTGSLAPTTDHVTGTYSSARMSVEVTVAPRNAAGLSQALQAEYTEGSGTYHQWLAKGEFDALYAPTNAERSAVVRYLQSAGLQVSSGSSPFLIRATGSSQRIESAFRTSLLTYRNPQGVRYFSNSTAVSLPSAIAPTVLGVVGLTNTVRLHSMLVRPDNLERPLGVSKAASSGNASCETGYVTTTELFNLVNTGTGFSYGYGDGPGCSGLTPRQTNSIYGAPDVGSRGKGAGVTLALFELSWYRASNISHWARKFYGHSYSPPLRNVVIDGGPVNPVCPGGDQCPPQANNYANDAEVVADIEMSLEIAPDAHAIDVYNAPNDSTGQTELDEYTAIASQDQAATVSSSWAACENDVPSGYVQAENVIFEQMAMQGQSMFGAAGDTGAFGCIRADNTVMQNVADPPSQPWVTSVGGTSLESDNPRTNPDPGRPAAGTETVWNVDNLCSNQAPDADNDGQGGYFWCDATGAGGGGFSQYWGRPSYQQGPGVDNPAFPNSAGTMESSGIAECSLAATGTPCREVPDVSADADPYTGYTEYCTGNPSPPDYSACGTLSGIETVAGWFEIGGTSLATPLWAALIADRDSYQGHRTGNINALVYKLLSSGSAAYFNDITGHGSRQQAATTNGLFPTTPGYDMATGVGSPKFAAWITGS